LKFSHRVQNTQFSPIRKLAPLAAKLERRNYHVFKLNIGQPDLEMPEAVFKSIRKYKNKVLPYAPSEGFEHLIEAWQKYFSDFNLKFSEDEILVTTGASEAIIFALAATCDAGDEVIVFEPFYTNYQGFASIAQIKLVPIALSIENGFHLPPMKEIEKRISKKTRAIILCNPNNPTGAVYFRDELIELTKLIKKFKLWVINDEVYREFVYPPFKFCSLFDFRAIRDQIILVDSVSKRFNLCGARIGCLASHNKNLVKEIIKFAQARLSSPTLEQSILIPLLTHSQKYTRRLVKEYQKRRRLVIDELKMIPGIVFHEPEGAFYMMIKIPGLNTEHFARWLLEKFHLGKKTLMVAPAGGFYASNIGHDQIRISFCLSQKDLKKAIRIFKIALDKYKGK
jgi:aspartate aminotransferase